MRFLTDDETRRLREDFGTPLYVYDQASLEASARDLLAFPASYGLTARFAMKALPTAAILRIFHRMGLHIDASSGFEADRALRAGVPPDHIQITAQEIPKNLAELVKKGVLFNACSMHQLRTYGESFPNTEVCVRINPGLGSGHSNRTNVGGPAASFGIWHEHLDAVLHTAKQHRLRITAMHSHVGSGTDPSVWTHCARLSLNIAARLPHVTRLNLGGGFKAGRMPGEESADLQEIGTAIRADFERFHQEHGRKLHLELEPGTLLVANAGAIVATVIDAVDTGPQGYRFLKTDTGMTELLRPAMYGAQHPITLVTGDGRAPGPTHPYIIVGHCCESGDILTPAPGDPEGLAPRELPEGQTGDLIVIDGAGAYCAAQAAKNYNAFPEAPEVLKTTDGTFTLIRKRQTFDQTVENEMP